MTRAPLLIADDQPRSMSTVYVYVCVQVHLATLNGQKVVVKVQRPGLKQLFDIDLKNVRVLAQWLQNVDPKSDGAARDWVAIYDECSRILYQVSASVAFSVQSTCVCIASGQFESYTVCLSGASLMSA